MKRFPINFKELGTSPGPITENKKLSITQKMQ